MTGVFKKLYYAVELLIYSCVKELIILACLYFYSMLSMLKHLLTTLRVAFVTFKFLRNIL